MHDVQVSSDASGKARFALGHSTRLITDAYCSAAQAVRLGFGQEKSASSLDLAHFSPSVARARGTIWRERQAWDGKRVLLCLRSWELNYGVDVLLRAFAKAAKKDDDLRHILLGDGSQREHLLRILQDADLNDKVFLGGRVPNQDLITYYGAADLYVTPSHVDGSSVSLMEAMACGLPAFGYPCQPGMGRRRADWLAIPHGDSDAGRTAPAPPASTWALSARRA